MQSGGLNIQFFFEPEAAVVGVADTMRSPAFLAMAIIKSWISRKLGLESAMLGKNKKKE